MTGPGRPLGPVSLRWVKIPNRDVWVNTDTGQTTNRTGFRNIVAQKYGFRNGGDYDSFSRQLNGIGGLTGLKVRDIQRAHNLVKKYERDHGLPPGSFGIGGNFIEARHIKDWLLEPVGKQRNTWLKRMLDEMGVPPTRYRWAPGDS